MSAAAVVVIINRPRPQNAQTAPPPESISVLADPSWSSAQILRAAADQLDSGPGTGES